MDKAAASEADIAIFDLEDAVAPEAKPEARKLVHDRIAGASEHLVGVGRSIDGAADERRSIHRTHVGQYDERIAVDRDEGDLGDRRILARDLGPSGGRRQEAGIRRVSERQRVGDAVESVDGGADRGLDQLALSGGDAAGGARRIVGLDRA
mgnify:CR=1 FL=1